MKLEIAHVRVVNLRRFSANLVGLRSEEYLNTTTRAWQGKLTFL